MSRTMLLVGTRKGCFILESDGDRRDWSVRGPYCEGWPIYHAIHDADTGTIYAAAASEWHGAGVWRSHDLGESWELSSEGLTHDGDGVKLSKVSGLTAAHGRLLAGAEAVGVFESRDQGATWSLLSTLEGQPGSDTWNDPEAQPPGHLGVPAILPHPSEPSRYVGDRAGPRNLRDHRRRAVVDAAQPRPARGLAVGGSGGRLLRPQAGDVAPRQRPDVPAEPRRHASQRRRRPLLGRDHRRPAHGVRLRRRRPPARPRELLRVPLDPGHGRCMPDGHAAVWRTEDAGSSWRRSTRAAASGRLPGRPARGHGDRRARRAGPLLRHQHRPGLCERRRGRELERDRELPARRSRPSRWRCSTRRWPTCISHRRCPRSSPTSPGGWTSTPRPWTRRSTVSTSAGPASATGCASRGPALRRHINVFVERERAALDTALERGSRVDVIAAISGG